MSINISSVQDHATNEPKLGYEFYPLYNFGTIDDVGTVVMDGAGTATYTADEDTPDLGAAGKDLIVRCTTPIGSESDMVITITGKDKDGAAQTGTCTITARSAEDTSRYVTPSNGKKWESVSAVSATNGVYGDGFEVLAIPDYADDVEIGSVQSVETDPGQNLKTIYDHYDKLCDKKIRAEKKLTITASYRNIMRGLSRITGREVTMRVDIRDNGQAAPTETWLIQKCRDWTKVKVQAGEGEAEETWNPSYTKRCVFSGEAS